MARPEHSWDCDDRNRRGLVSPGDQGVAGKHDDRLIVLGRDWCPYGNTGNRAPYLDPLAVTKKAEYELLTVPLRRLHADELSDDEGVRARWL